jgi:hypothetical protein
MQNGVAHLVFKYTSEDQIPYGYCHCGCGQKTKISKHDNKVNGHVKGQPRFFIKGHNRTFPPHEVLNIFWSRVNKEGSIPMHCPELGACWEWTAYCATNGYGSFRVRNKTILVHRMSYEIANGKIEKGVLVCHKCDNPCCVNPKHLFLGTHKDNADDMVKKGRGKPPMLKGEKCPAHKLTKNEVIEIRRRYAVGDISQARLGAEYNVTGEAIYAIVHFKSWKDI